jgi:hypothetical protein
MNCKPAQIDRQTARYSSARPTDRATDLCVLPLRAPNCPAFRLMSVENDPCDGRSMAMVAKASVQARSALTVGDIEYRVQIGDLHESADGWCGLTQVEGDRPVPGRIADRDQGAQAGGVDETDRGEVEDEIVTRVVRERRGGCSEKLVRAGQIDFAGDRQLRAARLSVDDLDEHG